MEVASSIVASSEAWRVSGSNYRQRIWRTASAPMKLRSPDSKASPAEQSWHQPRSLAAGLLQRRTRLKITIKPPPPLLMRMALHASADSHHGLHRCAGYGGQAPAPWCSLLQGQLSATRHYDPGRGRMWVVSSNTHKHALAATRTHDSQGPPNTIPWISPHLRSLSLSSCLSLLLSLPRSWPRVMGSARRGGAGS